MPLLSKIADTTKGVTSIADEHLQSFTDASTQVPPRLHNLSQVEH